MADQTTNGNTNNGNPPNNSNTQLASIGQNIVVAINSLNTNTVTPVASVSEAVIDTASSGANTIIAASAGKVIKVYSMWFIVTAAVTATIKNGTTNLTGAMNLSAAGEGFFLDFRTTPWFTCSTGSAFNITLGGSVQISGRCYYTQS